MCKQLHRGFVSIWETLRNHGNWWRKKIGFPLSDGLLYIEPASARALESWSAGRESEIRWPGRGVPLLPQSWCIAFHASPINEPSTTCSASGTYHSSICRIVRYTVQQSWLYYVIQPPNCGASRKSSGKRKQITRVIIWALIKSHSRL